VINDLELNHLNSNNRNLLGRSKAIHLSRIKTIRLYHDSKISKSNVLNILINFDFDFLVYLCALRNIIVIYY
jgi:hypothetical protein